MKNTGYDICVVGGCGHVGLPLGLLLAGQHLRVVAYDVNTASIKAIRGGRIPFSEEGAEGLLKKVLGRTFFLSDDITVLKKSKVVIITIGTPVDEHINPQFTPMMKCIRQIEPYLSIRQTLILRSTLFPGTTDYVRRFFLSNKKKIPIAFCPERIAEGKAIEELQRLPQIVSAFDKKGVEVCRRIFSRITPEIIVLPPLEAELVKLFTNAWRYIKFAIANQFYMIASDHQADFSRIGRAMRHQYPRAADFPRPGFTAGPCLFKDTMQLSSFYGHHFFLGHAAMLVNEGLPDYLKNQLKREGDLSRKTVGILGMTFKGGSDDIRESLAFKLKKLLLFEGVHVLCADDFWKDASLVPREELIRRSDIIVIGSPHPSYRKIDLKGKRVIDVWEITQPS